MVGTVVIQPHAASRFRDCVLGVLLLQVLHTHTRWWLNRIGYTTSFSHQRIRRSSPIHTSQYLQKTPSLNASEIASYADTQKCFAKLAMVSTLLLIIAILLFDAAIRISQFHVTIISLDPAGASANAFLHCSPRTATQQGLRNLTGDFLLGAH